MSDSSTTGSKNDAPLIAGRYELEQRVGEGALFDVARARDRETGRTVAVKILKSALARDRRFAARLVAEAKATESLIDSHVARVFDSGLDDGSVCIVTEFVPGANLRDRIRRTAPMPVAVAVDIAVEIAEALAAAHAAGIVHGDLRPENVLLTQQSFVKVADFGLSRAISASPDLEQNSLLRWVQCASWEAAEGQIPTPASDTYSLGCILYEMLTGAPVFPGDNAIVVALKHAKDTPRPIDAVNPSVPKPLADLVMRCLEKEPGARYAEGAAMLADLRRIQDALRYNKPLDFTPAQVLKPVTHTKRPERTEDYYDDGDPKIVVILRALILMLIGAGLVAVCVLLYNALQPQKEIVVPDVIGKDKGEAQQILLDKGLQSNLKMTENRRHAGEVVNQDPEPNGTVRPNRTILLLVSKGPRMTTVPALTEMSIDRAREIAAAANLAVKKTALKHSEDIQKDYVMDQDPPAAEQVAPGSTVKVTVSLGPVPVPAPPPPVDTYNPDNPAPPGASYGAAGAPTGRPRSFKISFQIPATGYEEPVEVQLVIVDDRGETTVADEQHRLGEVVTKNVDTVGDGVRIRVFLNGKLYSQELK
ncbi:MAG TPA: protein kinase [Armatimonadota bacterium]|jgi:serine/threonine-protein kinase